MGEKTGIKWTESTFNLAWGCQKVSPACQNCYAEKWAARVGQPDLWKPNGERRTFGPKHWAAPLKWNQMALEQETTHLVFCGSMCDVFEDHPTVKAERQKLFPLIESTPHLVWQLLTKRPENIMKELPDHWREKLPENVWVGTTVENQQYLETRAPLLLQVPATVRFFSCEPLLGQIDLSGHRPEWVIVGGESGPGFRALNLEYARNLADQCLDFKIPFFFKQVGGVRSDSGGHELDGEFIQEFPGFYEHRPFVDQRKRFGI